MASDGVGTRLQCYNMRLKGEHIVFITDAEDTKGTITNPSTTLFNGLETRRKRSQERQERFN